MDIGVIFLLVALGLGLLLGWAIGYFLGGRGGGSGSELKQKAEAHDALQADVKAHLQESARLMDDLSDNYRKVYEHLAIGSQRLTGAALTPPAAAASIELRPDVPADNAAAETSADTSASDAADQQPTEPVAEAPADAQTETSRRPD